MKTTVRYAIRSKELDGPHYCSANQDDDPRQVFEHQCAAIGIKPEDCVSFFRAAEEKSHRVLENNRSFKLTEKLPGEELIYKMRDLPEISKDASRFMAWYLPVPGAQFPYEPETNEVTEEGQKILKELLDAGLIHQVNEKQYEPTEQAGSYPFHVGPMPIYKISWYTREIEPDEAAAPEHGM